MLKTAAKSSKPKKSPAAAPKDQMPVAPPAALAKVEALVDKFIDPKVAFKGRNPVRDAEVARDYDRLVMLFPTGRWTAPGLFSANTTRVEVIVFKKHEHSLQTYYTSRGGVRPVEISDYLNGLADLGLIDMEDVKAFRRWVRANHDVKFERLRLERLRRDLAECEKTIAEIESGGEE